MFVCLFPLVLLSFFFCDFVPFVVGCACVFHRSNLRPVQRAWKFIPAFFCWSAMQSMMSGSARVSPFAIDPFSYSCMVWCTLFLSLSLSLFLLFSAASLSTQKLKRESGSWHVGFDSIWYRVIVAFFLLYLLLFLLLFFHSFFFAFLHSLFPPFCYICYNRLVVRLSWLPGRSSSSRRRKGIDRLCLFPLLLQHGLHFMMTFLTVNAILKGLDLLAEIQSTPNSFTPFLFFWFGFDHRPPL